MDSLPPFDSARFYLGSLCKYGHDWHGTGRSLRRIASNDCPDCERQRQRPRYKARAKAKYDKKRAYVDAIKLVHGCVDCGYRAHPAALHFDHLPGFEKSGNIAKMCDGTTMAKLDEEIAKCEIVCANCHAIRTAERRKKAQEGR